MPVSIGVNMRVTGHYSQGGRKYMEDKFSVAYQQTEDEKDLEYAYFGIFDGHGGSEAADYAKEHLMDSIVKQKQFWSDDDEDVLRAIRNGYMMTHMNMWKELEKWPKTVSGLPSTAGTTASVAFIRGGKIYIGHVGDSAIILGYQIEGQEKWSAKSLTSDHKPDSLSEMDRIHSSGGKVVAKAGVHRVVWNRPAMGPGGSLRCDEIPFLAVARSLGDLWSYNPNTDEFIVSPDPDVGVLLIDPSKYRCLIFGTDGLWNMVSAEAAVQLVQAAEKHNEKAPPGAPPPDAWLNPSKILVDCALQRWSSTKMRADNTSVVTLMMDPPGPPKNRSVHTSPQPPISNNQHHATAVKETEDSKPSVSSASSPAPESPPPSGETGLSPTPTRSLSIMKRFPEQRPLPPPPTSQPFTYTTTQEEEETLITNYGSPSESYFIARLLNKTQIRNTLENVYEEITSLKVTEEREIINAVNTNVEEETLTKTTIVQRTSIVPLTGDSSLTSREANTPVSPVALIESLDEETVEERHVRSTVLKSPTAPQENIQINEVSSSSPVEAPSSAKGRKCKNVNQQSPEMVTPCRNLRSHDAAPVKPHSRLTNKSRQPPTRSKNNGESKVPVASNTSFNTNNKSTLVDRPKLSLATTNQMRSISTKVQKHVPVITKMKQSEAKSKPTSVPSNQDVMEPVAGVSMRVTRSKDVAPTSADILIKAVKKPHYKPELESTKPREDRSNVVTRQRNSVQANAPSLAPRTFLRRQAMESENSKENMVGPSTSEVPLKSAKRRNSGSSPNDLEPKEKRRTRLDDKRKSDKVAELQEDVTSSERKDGNVMLGIHVASVVLHCLADVPSKRSLRSVEEGDSTPSRMAKARNKKEKRIPVLEDVHSSEVHSTTINLENEPLPSTRKTILSIRALRSRQEDAQNKNEEDKRCLRSTERSIERTPKEARPVLRSRNTVTGVTPKATPRRIRNPWNLTTRQNLRKRFSK